MAGAAIVVAAMAPVTANRLRRLIMVVSDVMCVPPFFIIP